MGNLLHLFLKVSLTLMRVTPSIFLPVEGRYE